MRRVPTWLLVYNALMLVLIVFLGFGTLQSQDAIHRLELKVDELKNENSWQTDQIFQQQKLQNVFYDEFQQHELHPPVIAPYNAPAR